MEHLVDYIALGLVRVFLSGRIPSHPSLVSIADGMLQDIAFGCLIFPYGSPIRLSQVRPAHRAFFCGAHAVGKGGSHL